MGFLEFTRGFLEFSTLRPGCPCPVVLEESEPVEHVGGAGDELLAEAPDVVVPDAHGLVLLLAGLLEGAHAVGAVVLELKENRDVQCMLTIDKLDQSTFYYYDLSIQGNWLAAYAPQV